MNTSAKYQANWTETVGGVVRTRFCGQTDRPPARLTDRLIRLGGCIIMVSLSGTEIAEIKQLQI